MVHPYLRRHNREESVDYPSEELSGILRRTLGIPLFQEQAMKIAIVAGGFTPAEADELSCADERSPFPVKNKRPQIRQNVLVEPFLKARNFK